MYCYRFPDRDTFLSLALASGHATQVPDSPIELNAYTHAYAIDEIGPVVVTPGVYDNDGNEVTPPVMDNRHHLNFKGEAPESWDEHLVVVNSPCRIWAGGTADPVPGDDILNQI
jgi:hypothetical protein